MNSIRETIASVLRLPYVTLKKNNPLRLATLKKSYAFWGFLFRAGETGKPRFAGAVWTVPQYVGNSV